MNCLTASLFIEDLPILPMDKKELLEQLTARGFPDRIVKAFRKVPRENFIPKSQLPYAYEDIALPLRQGATVSQPSTIAFMLDLLELEAKEKVLEIGSGSGYFLALLSELTKGEIYGVEIIKELAEESKNRLKENKRINVIHKDGSKGLLEHAPFDRIIISASSQTIPVHLYEQLTNNGILVAPVRNSIYQIKKENGTITKREFPGFVFVPLEGDASFP